MRVTTSTLVLGFVLGGALAGSAASVTYVKAQPAWAEAPTVADVAAAYPARAKAEGVKGTAELTCSIGHDDRPRDCAVLHETGNYGFGAAAKKLAAKLKVEQSGMYGQDVYIPFSFDPSILSGAATVTQPNWAQMPEVEDLKATFPQTQNGVNHVRVVLGCTVDADGGLDACKINQEDPAGQGYGAGALALAPKFRMQPWGAQGEPVVGAHINLPIRYELTPVAAGAKPQS
ncbi:energy transducer TonB [Phenylobacterium sp.]|jgi:TonB family protein|uniref:energy transducer TonB family protein n=1 Tax=Phenylobacterium sp. TaxID=1871053 RepID=UPI002F3EBAF0